MGFACEVAHRQHGAFLGRNDDPCNDVCLVMIYASLSFSSGLTALEGLVAALYALPPPLRPTHHSIGEDDVRQPTGEATALVRMLETGGSRFLWGRGVSYSVSPLVDLTCRAFFTKAPSQLARAFLEGVSAAEPVFGYACAWEELLHRNRLFVQIDGEKGELPRIGLEGTTRSGCRASTG